MTKTNIFDLNELKKTNRLPSPSGTALEIMRLLQRDDVLIKDVAELIQTDPALSARIIKFVNSAGAGNQRKIMNANDAIVMAGMETVKNFVLSLSIITQDSRNRCHNFSYVSYWSLSLGRAIGLMEINRRAQLISPEEAFTFGLLADIGRLAIATAWSDKYSDCLHSVNNDEDLKLVESKMFGIHHDEMSFLLLEDWGFSGVFIDAIAANSNPYLRHSNSLAVQLKFAEKLGFYCMASESEREDLLPYLIRDAEQYNLYRLKLLPFLDELLVQWKEWGNLIDINTNVPYSKLFFLKNNIA